MKNRIVNGNDQSNIAIVNCFASQSDRTVFESRWGEKNNYRGTMEQMIQMVK